jgi:hypothetical protein
MTKIGFQMDWLMDKKTGIGFGYRGFNDVG